MASSPPWGRSLVASNRPTNLTNMCNGWMRYGQQTVVLAVLAEARHIPSLITRSIQ
jgi:hypothetical protein